ncbi:hypothetical protein HYV86_07565 [Candidatus Woesearchaeota archaeon]|nr:hypothetical protein [Candidatus Woesearchaeota archaeon]
MPIFNVGAALAPRESFDGLIEKYGSPTLNAPQVDIENAVAHRTWLALAKYVEFLNPQFLNGLFQGIELPTQGMSIDEHVFPPTVDRVLSAQARQAYAILELNPRHFGSVETRLKLFDNLVRTTNDPLACFNAGRSVRVVPDLNPLRAGFLDIQKGLAKAFGANPGKLLESRLEPANAALNRFLSVSGAGYGGNYLNIRVEYFPGCDISPLGDQYTLGVLVAGLEQIAAYKKLEIRCIQSPFDPQTERQKLGLATRGVEYDLSNYHQTNGPVFIYRLEYHEKAEWFNRIGRAIVDFSRRHIPSRQSKAVLTSQEAVMRLLTSERQADEAREAGYRSTLAAAVARADAAEAEREAESQRSAALEAQLENARMVARNQEVGEYLRTSIHDIINAFNVVRAELITTGGAVLKSLYSPAEEILPSNLVEDKRSLREIVSPLLEDSVESIVRSYASHLVDQVQAIDEQVLRLRQVMKPESVAQVTDVAYGQSIDRVIKKVRTRFPSATIEYSSPDDSHTVSVNGNLLEMVLFNLVNNAIEGCVENGYDSNLRIHCSTLDREDHYRERIIIYQQAPIPENILGDLNAGVAKSSKGDKGSAVGASSSRKMVVDVMGGDLRWQSPVKAAGYGAATVIELYSKDK